MQDWNNLRIRSSMQSRPQCIILALEGEMDQGSLHQELSYSV